MVDYNKIAAELHADAVAKGFWDVPYAIEKHIAKMHSELSEALQEDRCGRPMLYVDDIQEPERVTDVSKFDGRKPEGIAAELADFVMMTLDLFAETGLNINALLGPAYDSLNSDLYVMYNELPLHRLVLHCHDATTHLLCGADNDQLISAIFMCTHGIELWLKQRGVNLWDVIALKRAYNKNRPALHGRKY